MKTLINLGLNSTTLIEKKKKKKNLIIFWGGNLHFLIFFVVGFGFSVLIIAGNAIALDIIHIPWNKKTFFFLRFFKVLVVTDIFILF